MPLRPYQADVLSFSDRANGRFVYADAAGSGKTPTTSALLAVQNPKRTLVVAPDAVIDHWLAELEEWTPFAVIDGRGTPQKRASARLDVGNFYGGQPSVLVVNYDLLRRDRDKLLPMKFEAFVADEAHRLKSREKPTATAGTMIARRAKFATFITGTPVLNRAEELWPLLHMVDPKTYSSFWRWAYLHFDVEVTDFHGKLQQAVPIVGELKPGHDVLIRNELEGVLIARSIDDLLPDLPKVTNHIVPVELSPAERVAYDSMMSKGWAHVNGHLIDTSNALTKATRLRQLSSDWSGLVEDEGLALGAKVEASLDVLDTTEQVVVLAAFKAPVEQLVRRLDGAVRYDGSVSPKTRREAVKAFASGDAQFIVGTIAAMGEGIDGLQVARSLVRLDRDWTPARNEQVVARIRRSGQRSDRIHVVDVVAADTTDEWIAEMLARKTAGIEKVLVR